MFDKATDITEGEPRRKDTSLRAIYGIGEKTESELHEVGILTCYDLAEANHKHIEESVDRLTEKDSREFVEQAQSIVEYWPDD